MAKGSRVLKGRVHETQISKTVVCHLELLHSVGNIPHILDARPNKYCFQSFLIMLHEKNWNLYYWKFPWQIQTLRLKRGEAGGGGGSGFVLPALSASLPFVISFLPKVRGAPPPSPLSPSPRSTNAFNNKPKLALNITRLSPVGGSKGILLASSHGKLRVNWGPWKWISNIPRPSQH